MNQKRGVILIINILLVILIGILALPIMTFFVENSRSSIVDKENLRAKYMAYSGVQYGLYKYVEESELSGEYDIIDDVVGFTWNSVLEGSGGSLTITSTGYSEKAMFRLQDEIEVTYAAQPTLATQDATNIGTTYATLNMTYDFKGSGSGHVRFRYQKRGAGSWTDTSWTDESGSGTYSIQVTGLQSNKWHDFYAQLKYDSTVIDGTEESFKTAK